MVSRPELVSRIKEYFGFDKQEVSTLIIAILITGFIFSFRDWGVEQFNLAIGLKNLMIVLIIAAISFFFRISCQKIYGLSQGYQVQFKVWWAGIVLALIIAFVTVGRLPLVLIGGVVSSFIVKQRLGEFRYGASSSGRAMIGFWGVLGNLIMAILFAIGAYFLPQSFFFNKGIILNLIMGFSALIPLPQLDGLGIFFGSRALYYVGILTVLLTTLLLVTKTKIGLLLAIIIASLVGIVYILIGSEK